MTLTLTFSSNGKFATRNNPLKQYYYATKKIENSEAKYKP
jgi:hypothetical protein